MSCSTCGFRTLISAKFFPPQTLSSINTLSPLFSPAAMLPNKNSDAGKEKKSRS